MRTYRIKGESMDNEQKKIYHGIICDAWDMMKEHLDKVTYDDLVLQVHKLSEKYAGQREYTFASAVVVAVMEELDRLHGIY